MIPLHVVKPVAKSIIEALKCEPDVIDAAVAGSTRRWVDLVEDIDVVCCTQPSARDRMMKWLKGQGINFKKLALDKASVTLPELETELKLSLCGPVAFGAQLAHMTGSIEHNKALRERFSNRGLFLNEYGVFNRGARVGGPSERQLYDLVDLPFHPPEIREDGVMDDLPDLVTKDNLLDVVGITTSWTGGEPPELSIDKALGSGARSIVFADPLRDLKEFHSYTTYLKSLKHKYCGRIRVGISVSTDIDDDGLTNVPDDPNLDFITATLCLHRKCKPITRMVRALKLDPRIGIIAKVSGRYGKWQHCEGGCCRQPIDSVKKPWEWLFRTAASRGVIIEIDSDPTMLDPPSCLIRIGREQGCKFVIGSGTRVLSGDTIYGIKTARKGLLTKSDLACVGDLL